MRLCNTREKALQKKKTTGTRKRHFVLRILLVAVFCLCVGCKGEEPDETNSLYRYGMRGINIESVEKKNIESTTALVYSLPDDSANEWTTNDWIESETHATFKNSTLKLPKKGIISFKICYPNEEESLSRTDSFELFLVDYYGWTIGGCDVIAEGTIGEDWLYTEHILEYEFEEEITKVLFKTHSVKGSPSTLLGIGDIIVTDTETNEVYKFDLKSKDTKITCREGVCIVGHEKDCEYEILELN